MPITNASTKRKLRTAGRKGRARQARNARLSRRNAVRRALEAADGHLVNVAEIAEQCGRSPGVVRAALSELENVEKIGTHYHLITTQKDGSRSGHQEDEGDKA